MSLMIISGGQVVATAYGNVGNTLTSLTQDSDTRITGTITLDNATGNEAALTLNYTTNKAAGDDTGLLINMTDTSSPGTSYLIAAQKGGTTNFYVTGAGAIFAAAGITTPNLIATTDNTRFYLQNRDFTGSNYMIQMAYGTFSGAGVTQAAIVIMPTYNQSTTSAGTDLLINRTETAVGSGEQLFLSMGTTAFGVLTKFRNDGVYFPRQAATASAPTYTEGGIYYDTTLHKLRIGGAAGWETVTSA